MTADGIHYKTLIQSASLSDKMLLCPAGIREMLKCAHKLYSEEQMHALAAECIDLPVAVRDNDGFNVVMSLINRHCEEDGANMQERMSSYVLGIPAGMSNKVLRDFLLENPRLLLDFLKYTRGEEPELSDRVISDKLKPVHGLYYYQLAAARKITKCLEESPHCVMYHAPTGSGKTRTAMNVVTKHFRMHGPTVVLWLAASTELVGQAAKAFKDAWMQHGDIFCMMHIWQGDSPHFTPDHKPSRNDMLIAGLQKVALACGNEPDLPGRLQEIVSLIVFDEAHQSVAPTYRRLIDGIMEGGRCRLLGLSATPGRADEQGTKELASLYHGQKVTIEAQRGLDPIGYLEQEGYLAKPNFHHINVEGGLPSTKPENSVGYSHEELGKIGRDMQRNAKIVNIVMGVIKKGHSRILVFSPSVDSARMCAAMLKSLHGVDKSDMIWASTPKDIRMAILNQYSEKTETSAHVIFNYGILTTGFDAPGTSAAVIARPTTSVSLYSQMVGRAIRGVKSGGSETADIYTVLDTSFPQFGSVVAAFENWNTQWEEGEQ